MSKQQLILLFGMPRSGTTWVGKLLDSHPESSYFHEPDSVEPDFSMPLLMKEPYQYPDKLVHNVNCWLSSKNEKVIASRPFFKKSYLNIVQWSVYLMTAYLSKFAIKAGVTIPPVINRKRAKVIIWKSIESLGRMEAIKANMECRAIHILRHPCGQIASTLNGESKNKFDCSMPTSDDFDLFNKLLTQSGEQRFSMAQIKQMQPEERLALKWGIMNDFSLSTNTENSLILIYEDLCRNPKEVFQQLLSFSGLTLTNECIDYLNQSTNRNDKTYYGTEKIPLKAAYKWRDFLNQEQQRNIKTIISQFKSGQLYLNDF